MVLVCKQVKQEVCDNFQLSVGHSLEITMGNIASLLFPLLFLLCFPLFLCCRLVIKMGFGSKKMICFWNSGYGEGAPVGISTGEER